MLLLARPAFAQDNMQSYLLKNSAQIDTSTIAGFSVLDKAARDYNVFFAGEAHYQRGNSELEIALFKYFHTYGDVRILLIEQGYSYGLLVNWYLQTGDEKYLDKISYPGNDSEKQSFFSSLYEFYASLPADEKFIAVGLDYEKSLDQAMFVLDSLLPSSAAPDSIRTNCDSIARFAASADGEYWVSELEVYDMMVMLVRDIQKHPAEYKNYLGGSYYDVVRIAAGLIKKHEWSGVNFNRLYDGLLHEREEFLYGNFSDIPLLYPGKKCFGQFGGLHTPRSFQHTIDNKYSEWNSLAARINSSSSDFLNGKVCSIAYLYMWEQYFIQKGLRGYDRTDFTFSDRRVLKQVSKPDGAMIFNLEKSEKLFKKQLGKYQYIIVNRY
jgi:hypothetical protein